MCCSVANLLGYFQTNHHRLREYTKSLYLPYFKSKKGKWFEVMTKIFPQYSDEYAAEVAIFDWRKYYN